MATQVGDNQTIDATATPVDAGGGTRSIEAGSAKWASSDEAVATVAADPANELHAIITPVAVGTCTISVTGDADLGAGVTTITGSGDLEVIAGEATGFTLAFGNPQPKPAPAP